MSTTVRYLDNVLDEVSEEAARARGKFGDQFGLSEPEWLAVLTEEVGEAAKDVTQRNVPPVDILVGPTVEQLRAELVQVAAVAARWIRAIDFRASRT